MPPRRLLRAFLALWLVTGLGLLIASVVTVREAWMKGPHANPHLVLLGSIEAAAALLFIVPRTSRMGALVLLGTIGLAIAIHTTLGQFRGDLLIDAATVLFVFVHGPLTGAQWRTAISRTAP